MRDGASIAYEEYLRSPRWRATRRRYKAQRPWACYVCGTTFRLHLHHRTYARLGREKLDDLVPLCHDHHKRVHELVSEKKATLYRAHEKLASKVGVNVDSYNGLSREGGWNVVRVQSQPIAGERRKHWRRRARLDRERVARELPRWERDTT